MAPSLLDTYSEERRAKAIELIDFDKDMARLFSAKPKDAAEAASSNNISRNMAATRPASKHVMTRPLITGTGLHQALAAGLRTGMRFHSAPVIRLADAKPMQLGHALKA